MLLAAVRRWRRCRPASVKAAFTSAWQASNGPSTSKARTLSPQHVSWCCWRGDTCPFGNSTPTRMPLAAMKRRSDGSAGVARRRDENRQRPGIRRAAQRALHERGEETRPDVLERGRRAVEELEHGELAVRSERLQRQRESRTHRCKWRRARSRAPSLRRTARAPRPRSRPANRRARRGDRMRGSSSGTNKPPSAARPRITASTRPVPSARAC